MHQERDETTMKRKDETVPLREKAPGGHRNKTSPIKCPPCTSKAFHLQCIYETEVAWYDNLTWCMYLRIANYRKKKSNQDTSNSLIGEAEYRHIEHNADDNDISQNEDDIFRLEI